MKKILLLVGLAALAPAALQAQGTPAAGADPVVAAARQFLQRYSRNLVAAAQAMPAEKYEYKPTPQQVTYGALMSHVASSNVFLCNALSGAAQAGGGEEGKGMTRDQTVAALQRSFTQCDAALAGLHDAELGAMVPFFGGRQASKATALLALTGDWMDHYATASNYLRLNGILPPTAQPRS